jgi:hypothetical protein
LINRSNQTVNIFIDQSAKQDFMKIMGWSEIEFIENTILVRDGKEEKEIILTD